MSTSSTLYTIGTALNRAQEHDQDVAILVDGMWISGSVVAIDGFGVVLHSPEEQQHSVVRVERIAAVTIAGPAPQRLSIRAVGT